MKRIFLSSSFADVAKSLETFLDRNPAGNTVTFIATASIPEKVRFYVSAGRKALERMGMIVEELDLARETPEHAAAALRKNPFIYVSGGNVFYLLQELRRTGCDSVICNLIESGTVYIGESAGAMILAPDISYAAHMDSPKAAPDLGDYTGLAAIDFYPVPHFGNAPFKKAANTIVDAYGKTCTLYPISNAQYIAVRGSAVSVHTGEKIRQ